MTYFTDMNTEGFNQADMDQMNRALDILAAEGRTNDENHISDFINNAYEPGRTAEEYVTRYTAAYKA